MCINIIIMALYCITIFQHDSKSFYKSIYTLAKMNKAGINIPLQRESTEDQEARNRKGLVFTTMYFLQYIIDS